MERIGDDLRQKREKPCEVTEYIVRFISEGRIVGDLKQRTPSIILGTINSHDQNVMRNDYFIQELRGTMVAG